MDLALTGKRAIVTAASRGLGRASAIALAGEGVRVAVASRDRADHPELVDALRAAGAPDAIALEVDLSIRETLLAGIAEATERFGGIDIAVGNTGGPPSGPFESIAREQWVTALDETLLPMVDLSLAVVPGMKAAGGGRIIFITTVGVKIVQPNMVLSDSIRLAITGLAKSMSHELAGDNILVNTLCPGPVATDRMQSLIENTMAQQNVDRATAEAIWLDEVPLGQMGDPADFGALVAVLASDKAAFVTGAAIAVDGGKSRAY
jgi:3-oxoacyl-[acyl-carrier protein] reductase